MKRQIRIELEQMFEFFYPEEQNNRRREMK